MVLLKPESRLKSYFDMDSSLRYCRSPSTMEKVDAIVIGAGVVGLAVGRELARRGLETVVTEAQGTIGQGMSSRNSEVIHAGLYLSLIHI